jgi:hypothetical protein
MPDRARQPATKNSRSESDRSASGMLFAPGPTPRSVKAADGEVHLVPTDWELLPPGDPGLTRRVKAAGPYWQVQESRGRKVFSRGVWAHAQTIAQLRSELEQERGTPAHAKRQAANAARRSAVQANYVTEFATAVVAFLAFHPRFHELALTIGKLVAEHATPVGSGTVARTQRLSVEQRARAAVVAWMRHQTTEYDQMKIARVKGKRREVRRDLAQQSLGLLARYRQGNAPLPNCPLMAAVESAPGQS